MANYGVFGTIKTPDGTLANNAKVYPYFKKVSSSAPPSKWTDTPYTASNIGYYSFNLGDNALIGSESNIVKGTDKIYLAIVWNENDVNDQDRNSLTFTHCSFIELVTTNDDFIEVNLTIEPKRLPIVTSTTLTPDNLLTRKNYTISETSYVDYSWKSLAPYSEKNISQKLIYDLVPIFDGHQLIDTLYDWGEIQPREVTNNSSDTYQYQIAGVYTQCITVREKWNTEVQTCKEVTVKYNKPNPDFDWSPKETNNWQGFKIKGTELITFHNLSSDIDNRTRDEIWGSEKYTYNWIIEDTFIDGTDNTQTYNNKDFAFEPTHQFQSPGTKTIRMEINWNDGFQDFTEFIEKQITIEAFDIVPNFEWSLVPIHRNQDVNFINTSTGDISKIEKLDWYIEDNYPAPGVDLYTFSDSETSIFNEGSPDNTQRVDNSYTFLDTDSPTVKFHSIEPKNIRLVIHYFNGWETVQEEITKTLTPLKYSTEPAFTISDKTPMGRDKTVNITNTTNYIFESENIGYSIDWELDDYYMACNLDNPNPGTDTDNSIQLFDVINTTQINHNYQNTSDNNIKLTIRYDDGWQMQTKRLTNVVTPKVYPSPIPNFVWDITPINRDELVTFSNTTSDPYNLFRAYDWTINDHYNKYNPNNPDYGISEKDNKQVINYNTDYNLQPTHKFQDNTNENIIMRYYFDDGFCERSETRTKTITKDNYVIIPDFSTNIVPINNGFYGKNEIIYTNSSTGDIISMLDEKWVWNDRVFMTEADNIIVRNDQVVGNPQPFTFSTPSRKPYSAVDGSLTQNINKDVSLEIRIDTGWAIDTDLGEYQIPGSIDFSGGQVYYLIEKSFEATPFEVSSNISYICNIENYTH